MESQRTEWKRIWKDEYLKSICAFANSQGGDLLIGIDDDGTIVGVSNSDRLLAELPNKIRTTMGIIPTIRLVGTKDTPYLVIQVEGYPFPVSYKGRYYIRCGSTTQLLTGLELDKFMLKKQGMTWDSVATPSVSVTDLKQDAIHDFSSRAFQCNRLSKSHIEVSDSLLLKNLNLLDGNHVRRAGVVLFHPSPEQLFVGTTAKIGFFLNDADLRFQDELTGPLIELPDKIIELLYTKYLKAEISYKGLYRVETFPFPEAAVREILLNALVHKDYGSGTPIQIRVYDDRLSIWNPGALPQGITLENLFRNHPSLPYNPHIANVMFKFGMIEAWGRGYEKVQVACATAGIPVPTVEVNPSGILVCFKAPRGGLNGGLNGGLSSDSDRILQSIHHHPGARIPQIVEVTGISTRTVERHIKTLKSMNLIHFEGSKKTGGYFIVPKKLYEDRVSES